MTMSKREGFFAMEARALRRLADALPGRGALTLLGAPILAVIATFCLQPKASGSETSTDQSLLRSGRSPAALAAESAVAESAASEDPFEQIASAIDARELVHARKLLEQIEPNPVALERDSSESSAGLEQRLWESYALMIDCLDAPTNDVTAHAYRFYLEQAPASARQRLAQACSLADPL